VRGRREWEGPPNDAHHRWPAKDSLRGFSLVGLVKGTDGRRAVKTASKRKKLQPGRELWEKSTVTGNATRKKYEKKKKEIFHFFVFFLSVVVDPYGGTALPSQPSTS
jgi:hypothetical protein